MPKLGMKPLRQRQLIEATIASIETHGLAETTVQTISRAAGVSSGIIHHYFGGKEELLEATMRSMLRALRADVSARLQKARTSRARLDAIVAGNFAPAQFERAAVTAWLAFWAEAQHAPALARLQRIGARRLRSNILHALRELAPRSQAERAADALAALIDGLWLHAALTGTTDGTHAAATVRAAIDAFLAQGRKAGRKIHAAA